MIAVERAVTAPPGGLGSIVRLSAEVPGAFQFDRIFLALGGWAWFRGLFRRALENLDDGV